MEKTRVYLITEYPWFAAMLNQCVFTWSDKIQTACVRITKDGHVELAVNKVFFYALSEHARVGLLKHEMLHVAMRHLTRGKGLDKRRANVAMDIAINQYIPSQYLPPGALLPNQFKLEMNKSFERYYLDLLKREDPPQDPMDDHNWDQSAESDQSEASCAPNESNQSQDKDTEQLESNQSETETESTEVEQSETSVSGLSDDMKEEIISRMVSKAIEESESILPGSTPIHVKKELEATQAKKSQINWKHELRQYIGRRYSGETESTRNRLNRRLGFSAPGQRKLEAPKVIIAIDQSGSVSDQACVDLLNETRWILNSIADKTEVVFFDTEIAHSVTLSKLRELPKRYASGGTDFQSVVNYVNNKRPDLLIMLTDGECSMPNKAKYPILWTIIGKGITEHLKGKVIRLENNNDE